MKILYITFIDFEKAVRIERAASNMYKAFLELGYEVKS